MSIRRYMTIGMIMLSLLCEPVLPTLAAAPVAGESVLQKSEVMPAWASREVAEMRSVGIIEGYEDGTFRPDQLVTKEEFIWMTERMLTRTTGTVTDAQRQRIHDALFQFLPEASEKPKDWLNRQEAAVVVSPLFTEAKTDQTASYKDRSEQPEWARPAISKLAGLHIVQGYPDGKFHGEKHITRAEAAIVLYRVWEMLKEHDMQLIYVTAKNEAGAVWTGANWFIHEKNSKEVKVWGQTGVSGGFLALLPARKWEINIQKDQSIAHASVDLNKDGSFLELKAQRSAVLQGKVVDKEGKAANGAILAVTTNPTFYAITDATGQYSLDVLPEKQYSLRIVEDPEVKRISNGSGQMAALTGMDSIPSGFRILDQPKPDQKACQCSVYDYAGTIAAPAGGKVIQLNPLSLSDKRVPLPVDSQGNGGGGSEQPDRMPPAIPTGLTASAGNKAVSLNWSSVSDTDTAGYKVYLSVDGGVTWESGINAGNVTSYNVTGLANGTLYSFAVTAYDTTGNESAKSSTVNATPAVPPDTTAPAVPTGLVAEPGNGTVKLSWSMVDDADVAGYKVYYSTDDGLNWSPSIDVGNVTTYTVQGLTNGTAYSFAVTAYDQMNNTSDKSIVTAVPGNLAKPDGLVAEYKNGAVVASWTPVQGADIAGYKLYLSTDRATWYTVADVINQTTYTLSNLPDGTYYLIVTAYTSGGIESAKSDSVQVVVIYQLPIPTGLAAVPQDKGALLTWSPGIGYRFSGYKVYRSDDGGTTWDEGTAVYNTAYTASSLTNGLEYLFSVTAYDPFSNAESAKSAAVRVTPMASLSQAPSGLKATAGDQSVQLRWSAMLDSDVAGYKVYVSTDGGAAWGVGKAVDKSKSAYTVYGLTKGTSYHFAMSAVDSHGMESAKSASVAATPYGFTGNEVLPDPSTLAPVIDPGVQASFADTIGFLYTGVNPIQIGVAPGAIEPHRAAVLRGKVLDTSGQPVSGAKVAIMDAPELGATLSRTDGMFDLVVNGGGLLTVQYSKEGYLTVQRKVQVPWEQTVITPNVTLTALDSKVTTIALKDAAQHQVARGTPVTDADGTRTATLLVPPGTTAFMKLPDGSTQSLDSMQFRATEYTVGENGMQAMPGELPDLVGYTYAVELSADEAISAGATEVRFSQPLYMYVDNFIGFPVGEAVPLGYYDRQLGQWVPSNNGKVIKILHNDNGVAALDVNGDDAPDGEDVLSLLGITLEERMKLAGLYTAGQSVWRVPIEHFTPWDCNWPYGPPEDIADPNGRQPNFNSRRVDDPCKEQGSIIGCQEQSLGETIPIAGTSLQLVYNSLREEGYKDKSALHIPLSGDSYPLSALYMEARVDIAGRSFSKRFSPNSNLNYSVEWDGKDAYGRTLLGKYPYKVTITYAFPAIYYGAGDFDRAFAQASRRGINVYGNRSAAITYTQRIHEGMLDSPYNSFREAGIAGWSFNNHHINHDSPGFDNEVSKGDGATQRFSLQGLDSKRLQYRGSATIPGSLVLGANYTLGHPRALGPDGNLYLVYTYRDHPLSPRSHEEIFKLSPLGVLTLVGKLHPSIYPTEIMVDSRNTIYIEGGHQILKKAETDADWMVVAGTGNIGSFSTMIEDGAVAAETDLLMATQLTLGHDGTLYFIQDGILYKMGTDGIIYRLGARSSGVDEGSVSKENIGYVDDIEMGPDGSLYLLDRASGFMYRQYDRIRKVSPDGSITLIMGGAGAQTSIVLAEGVDAADVRASDTSRFVVDKQGRVYIYSPTFQDLSQKLYRITSEGKIETVYNELIEKYKQLVKKAGEGSNGGSVPMKPIGVDPINGLVLEVSRAGSGGLGKEPYLIKTASSRVIPESDGSVVYEFDEEYGRHKYTRSAITGTVMTSFGYDNKGRIISQTDRSGNTITVERDSSGKPTAIVGPQGQRTEIFLDVQGRITAVNHPGGEKYQVGYNEAGLLSTFTDPNGNVSEYAYDGKGRLIQAKTPEGGIKTLKRTQQDNGYTVEFTNPDGLTTTYEVKMIDNKLHRITTDPRGAKTISVDNEWGILEITHSDGTREIRKAKSDPRWGMTAPQIGSLTVTTPEGRTVTYSETTSVQLGDPTNLLSVTRYEKTITLNGDSSKSIYDSATRTLTETTAAGLTIVTTYDDKDRTIRVEELGTGIAPMLYTYDVKGRIEKVQQGGQFRAYSYDSQGQLESVTDASGSSKRYTHDEAGRLTSMTLPGGNTYTKDYDHNGNVIGFVMPDGTRYRQDFSKQDLMTGFAPEGGEPNLKVQYTLGGSKDQSSLASGAIVDYEYDSMGRLTSMSDADLARTFTYGDLTQRVSQISSKNLLIGSEQNIAFTYDGSEVKSMTFSGKMNASHQMTYDEHIRLTNVTTTISGAVYGTNTVVSGEYQTQLTWNKDNMVTQIGPFEFVRSAPGQRIGHTTDGKLDMETTYTELGQIDSLIYKLNGLEYQRIKHSYDLRGWLTNKTVTSSVYGITAEHYEYDPDGQLLSTTHKEADDTTWIETYTYDKNRNRISRTINGLTETSTYSEHDSLEQVGHTLYEFNEDGYLSQRGGDTFRYAARGELLQATVSGATYHYTYDPLGRRTAWESGQESLQYVYSPLNPHQISATMDEEGTITTYHYGDNGLLLAMERNGSRYYVITDGVGTPKQVLRDNGDVIKELRYDSYGVVLLDTAPNFELAIGFAGGIHDPGTKLTRFGFRDYDAQAGRWTARDPVRFESGQANLYAYVNNNPIMLRDPCGLFCVGGSLYGGIGGGGKICIDPDNGDVSGCGEFGFGKGGGLEVNPSEDGVDDGIDIEITGKGALGPGKMEGGIKFHDEWSGGCLSAKPILKGELGPFKVDFMNPTKSGLKGKVEELKVSPLDIIKKGMDSIGSSLGVKVEAAIKVKGCFEF
ncbi:fibronectin type III domain-containing protein [Paenibacillus silviterrae]|uniref:fibronectin type III domain-containing protein n=1 Tax=Paenibacillus silviterrae TaxID=3242194 RepID=UPI002542FABC|nr:fibronectin type III domain-containing protein [Paenibacillus chinjuensis]